jgi:hypothetical protein
MIGRRGQGGLTPLLIQGLVKVVQKPDEVFVAVILIGLPEVVIDSALHCITDRVEEAHWSDVGGSVGGPHTLDEILVGEGDGGGHILSVGHEGGGQIFAEDEGIPFGDSPKELDGGIGVAGIPHILQAHDPLMFGVRDWLLNRLRRITGFFNGLHFCRLLILWIKSLSSVYY